MMNRRSFLKGLTATGSAGLLMPMAPAVVRAESIMKIWVPPEQKIVTGHDLVLESGEMIKALSNYMARMGISKEQFFERLSNPSKEELIKYFEKDVNTARWKISDRRFFDAEINFGGRRKVVNWGYE